MRGPETEKSHQYRIDTGFYDKYMQGAGLDIGYRGSVTNAEPVLPTAIGIDLGYPGYDGITLPFADNSQDYVFSSHMLEHVKGEHEKATIREWLRVLKPNGHLIIIVPHQFLYEKRWMLPSRWNRDHQRFYTPYTLMGSVLNALWEPNTWRLRHLIDNDRGYDYSIPPEKHAGGCYEIECVIQKITPPTWSPL